MVKLFVSDRINVPKRHEIYIYMYLIFKHNSHYTIYNVKDICHYMYKYVYCWHYVLYVRLQIKSNTIHKITSQASIG